MDAERRLGQPMSKNAQGSFKQHERGFGLHGNMRAPQPRIGGAKGEEGMSVALLRGYRDPQRVGVGGTKRPLFSPKPAHDGSIVIESSSHMSRKTCA